tara:strand:- start:2548 stop:3204 length:657 start_codon:yes stop_codon:yes gene_type:complete
MSYSRKIYDEKAYQHNLLEATEAGKYSLLSNATYNNQTCFQETPEIHASRGQYRISDNNDMVTAESDLFNLIRKDSNDPKTQFPNVRPVYKNKPVLESCKKTDLARRYPLLEAPVYKREQQIDRFESLCLDPQSFSRISSNQYIGLNTRLHSRDNYKQKLPVIADQSKHLPPASEFKSPMDEFVGFAAHLQKKPVEKKPAQKSQPKKENFSSGGCGCN